jgi:hypothetical protein
LLSQKERTVFVTPWKEEFRGKMREVLAKAGAEAPMFDSSLPSDFPGMVVKTSLVHVAVTGLTAEEAAMKASDWRSFVEAVRTAADIAPEAAIKPIMVSVI